MTISTINRRGLASLVLLSLTLPLTSGCANQGGRLQESDPTGWIERHHRLSSCTLRTREMTAVADRDRPPIVMINGVPVTGMIYQPLAETLHARAGVHALLVDLPGTGGSRLNDGVDYTWTNQRACLGEWLNALPPYYLAVHDLAGPIALPIATAADNIQGLILFNTVIRPTTLTPPFPLNWLRNSGPFAKPLAHSLPFPFYAWRLRQIGLARDNAVTDDFLRRLFDDVRADNGLGTLAEVMQGFEPDIGTERAIQAALQRDLPRLVIWGEADPVLGGEWRHLPESHRQAIRRLADTRHFPMLDHSTEIATWIIDWLPTRGAEWGSRAQTKNQYRAGD